MQRVSSLLPSWDKRASTSSTGASKASSGSGNGLFGWSNRSSTSTTASATTEALARINTAAANRNSNAASLASPRIQREAFWPSNLDIESEKAARIIKSFCADGYLAPLNSEDSNRLSKPPDEPQTPLKVPKKIPKRIIQNAAGIAVFTCMRNGLWMTGSGGSGILIARKSDGTWSPPSGIMLHTPTLSFIIGVDVYDCVLIINNLAALESISQPRVTLGEDVGLTGGALVSLEEPGADVNVKELGHSVMAYMKSRGQAQNVNLHGCILTERSNENERFYGSPYSPMDILSGAVARHVVEIQPLLEVIKLAEGRTDFDAALVARVAKEPAPGDAVIATPSSTPASPHHNTKFGVPNADDPDPFGILALEMAGLEIREAGSRLRPASSQLDFHHRPMSQLSRVQRQSGETFAYVPRSNRESCMSSRTVRSQMTDAHTQTDSLQTSPSPGRSEDGRARTSFDGIKVEGERYGEGEVDYTAVDLTALKNLSQPRRSQETLPDSTADSAKAGIGRDATLLEAPARHDDDDKVSKASSTYESTYGNDEDDDSHGRREGSDLKDRKGTSDDNDESDDSLERYESRDLKDVKSADDDADDEDDESDDEEPVVFEVATVQARSSQAVASRVVHAKGSVVTIPKRLPPPLPARNPARASLASRSDLGSEASNLHSPLQQSFGEIDGHASEEASQDRSSQDIGKSSAERGRSPPPNSVQTNVPRIEEPELDTPRNGTSHEAALELNDSAGKESLARGSVDSARDKLPEEVDLGSMPGVPLKPEGADRVSDSKVKQQVLIDTKVTDDVSSPEASSYTTPTSERRLSFPEVVDGNDQKKKANGESSVGEETPTKAEKQISPTREKVNGTEPSDASPTSTAAKTFSTAVTSGHDKAE